MGEKLSLISTFVSSVQRRLNRHRLCNAAFWSVTICGAGLLLVALFFILTGNAVPRSAYLMAIAAALVLIPVIWLVGRFSQESAARFADQFYNLKDTISSALHFGGEERKGNFYELQASAASECVAELSPGAIRYQWPRKLAFAAILVVGLSTLTAFKEPSPAVVAQANLERETSEKTAEINEFLEEKLEELADDLEKEGLTELDPEQFRELKAGLQETKNQQTALRQYAEMERQLRESAQRLQRRRDEAMLAKAGEELAKDRENRELGRKLKNKDFAKAAEDLKAMDPTKLEKESLSEQRKQLARLKSASQRMANAAKAANRKGSTGAKGESGSASGSQSSGSGLEQELTQLSEAAAKLDESLKNAERLSQQNRLDKKAMSECQSCQKEVSTQLAKLSDSLCKLGAMCESRKKLLSMCQKMGQCQGYLCQSKFASLGECMSEGTKPGGHKAGNGSAESRTNFSDSGNTGQLENLQGIKGSGPSETMVEDAQDGEGVATRRSSNQQREYARQMESFVQREDVPDAVKNGVKRYFEGIHQTAE